MALPKLAAVEEFEGSPGKRPPRRTLKPDPRPPRCPQWMAPEAKAVWKQLSPELIRLGMLTSVDGPAFAALCSTFGLARRAAQELKDAELADEDKTNKRLRKHPAHLVMRDSLNAFKGWAQEFGLTPAARAKLPIDPDDEPDSDLIDS